MRPGPTHRSKDREGILAASWHLAPCRGTSAFCSKHSSVPASRPPSSTSASARVTCATWMRGAEFSAPDGLPLPPPRLVHKVVGHYDRRLFYEGGVKRFAYIRDLLKGPTSISPRWARFWTGDADVAAYCAGGAACQVWTSRAATTTKTSSRGAAGGLRSHRSRAMGWPLPLRFQTTASPSPCVSKRILTSRCRRRGSRSSSALRSRAAKS
jgi:hypothetical protein